MNKILGIIALCLCPLSLTADPGMPGAPATTPSAAQSASSAVPAQPQAGSVYENEVNSTSDRRPKTAQEAVDAAKNSRVTPGPINEENKENK